MNDLSVTEPVKIKSKNLDVLAEHGKVERKNSANFVVIGKYCLKAFISPLADIMDRPCRRRKKHSHGSTIV